MSLSDYAGLKASIADHLADDGLTDQIEDFIRIAEARHQREIRWREMVEREALTIDDRYVSLPAGFLDLRNLRILSTPVTVLEEVSLHEMNRRREEQTGKPKFFVLEGDEIEFDVSPDTSYSGEIRFYKVLTPLSDSNPTNALLDRAPDAYLYAALAASAPYLLNDERVRLWETLYAQARDGLNLAGQNNKRGGPIVSRVAGVTP